MEQLGRIEGVGGDEVAADTDLRVAAWVEGKAEGGWEGICG